MSGYVQRSFNIEVIIYCVLYEANDTYRSTEYLSQRTFSIVQLLLFSLPSDQPADDQRQLSGVVVGAAEPAGHLDGGVVEGEAEVGLGEAEDVPAQPGVAALHTVLHVTLLTQKTAGVAEVRWRWRGQVTFWNV